MYEQSMSYTCKSCNQHLPHDAFYASKKTQCKACIAESHRTNPVPRRCKKCGECKPRCMFFAGKHCCKTCYNAACKKRREGSDSLPACLHVIMQHTQSRSKKIEQRCAEAGGCDVSLSDLTAMWESQRGLCALSGVPMTHTLRPHTSHLYNVSLDRIDSSGNYKLGNVQLVCQAVNIAKHSMVQSEFVDLCAKIVLKQSPHLCQARLLPPAPETGTSCPDPICPTQATLQKQHQGTQDNSHTMHTDTIPAD